MIKTFKNFSPKIGKNCYVAESATIIGEVELGDHVSIWPGAVLRGDMGLIKIGSYSNVQDNAVLHCMPGVPCVIGEYVTVGHLAHVHSATISNRVIVGSTSVILDQAIVESDVIVGAGSIVTPRKVMSQGSMVMGSPASVKRELSEEEKKHIVENALEYSQLLHEYI
jgi:carbonic anhydrase/acetyltransferase-like protein (isoleucine patch superfamily)